MSFILREKIAKKILNAGQGKKMHWRQGAPLPKATKATKNAPRQHGDSPIKKSRKVWRQAKNSAFGSPVTDLKKTGILRNFTLGRVAQNSPPSEIRSCGAATSSLGNEKSKPPARKNKKEATKERGS